MWYFQLWSLIREGLKKKQFWSAWPLFTVFLSFPNQICCKRFQSWIWQVIGWSLNIQCKMASPVQFSINQHPLYHLSPGLLPCIPGYNLKFAFHQAHIGISIYRPEWSHHFSRVSCSLSPTFLELFLFDVFSVVAINSLSFVIPGQPRNTTHIKQTLKKIFLIFLMSFSSGKMCIFGWFDRRPFLSIPGSWWHFSA